MEIVIQLVILVCLGATCAMIAHKRGRTPIGWFFIGMATPCIGLILVLALPDLKKQQAEFDRLRAQNRMLKERLDKDRIVADQRHVETEGRLRAHDRVLGLDTSATPEVSQRLDAAAPPAPAAAGPSADTMARLWFYEANAKEQGPLKFEALRALWQAGQLGPDSLVWAKGMQEWTPIRAIQDLSEALRG